MNWYIGQKIVAVRTHNGKAFKEGDIFTIKGIKKAPCKCPYLVFDIGISSNGKKGCYECQVVYGYTIWWMFETSFAPLDEMQAHESAIKELLKENEIHETIH